MKWLNFILFLPLWPLIVRNYWLRQHGKAPDEWYWADELAMKLGWSVDWNYWPRPFRTKNQI